MGKTVMLTSIFFLVLLFTGPFYLLFSGQVKTGRDWRTASRAPANLLALKPIGDKAAIILFSAPAFNWRGMFSTHTWLAVKEQKQAEYTIYQVVGWNQYRGKPIVDITHGVPDRQWYGLNPNIEAMLIGDNARSFIPRIKKAVYDYRYAHTYHAWPGPNSNTFVAYVLAQVPTLKFVMPYNALGRDYGWQWNIHSLKIGGVLGYHISSRAIAVNFLGLTLGVSFKPFGLIVPGVGLL
jgi:hypothetical protein